MTMLVERPAFTCEISRQQHGQLEHDLGIGPLQALAGPCRPAQGNTWYLSLKRRVLEPPRPYESEPGGAKGRRL